MRKGYPKKVLVIDEDEKILRLAKFYLKEQLGSDVHTVSSSEEGLKEATKFQPDLILIGSKITPIDPVAFLAEVRKIAGCEKTPIVVMISSGEEKTEQYLQAGAVDIIYKPIEALLFSSIVKGIWQKGG